MSAIYETRGRAREFCELAINLYTGCENGCQYCFGPDVTRQAREAFITNPKPRQHILEQIEWDARRYGRRGETRRILMCFVTDAYQAIDNEYRLARKAIEILHRNNLNVTILTKGGVRATRDFDLLRPGKDAFATTLTLLDDEESREWEPNAALPGARIESLQEAKKLGLETWVSIEPVIYPTQSLELIRQTHTFVDSYKVGKLNYHPHEKTIDWAIFAKEVIELLNQLNARFYIKKDLARYVGQPMGIRKGL